MSQSIVQSSQVQLTAYNVDGLELFFTPDRKVRASQSAIARMCEHVNDTKIRRFLDRQFGDVTPIKTQVNRGGKQSSLYNSEIVVACLAEFNPKRLAQFACFGIDEGLAQMAGVPLPAATPQMSSEEQLVLMAENSLKWAKLQLASKNLPGDIRQINAMLEQDTTKLNGSATLRDFIEKRGISPTATQRRTLGAIMSGAVKCRKEDSEIPKTNVSYKQSNGKWQVSALNVYPLTMQSVFDSACESLGL